MVVWSSGRSCCDICTADTEPGKVEYFVDGKVKGVSAWALMCPVCFERFGVGLGLGLGQKYDGMSPVPFLLEGDGAQVLNR